MLLRQAVWRAFSRTSALVLVTVGLETLIGFGAALLLPFANPRHQHEWRTWQSVKLPEGKVLIPGFISHAMSFVEHPELIADGIETYARMVGRENVIAGADCGFSSRATFKPEFVNRLDEIVEFHQLTREEIAQIVDVQVGKLIERVREKGVEVELTDPARELIGNLGYDPTYGARPLKRVIQKQLVDKLALKLLEGEFGPGDRVLVDAADGELRFEKAGAAHALAS